MPTQIEPGIRTATTTKLLLGNVDNTSDLSKPISTATQTALNLKAPLASPALTGVPTAPTASAGTNSTQIATTAFVMAASGLTFSTQASSFSAAVKNAYVITGNSVTATLPSSATRGEAILFILRASVTGFTIGRNTRSIQGVAENLTVDIAPYSIELVFDDTTNGWWMT